MIAKIWSKQLLFVKPDPTPYLMASSRYQLAYMAGGSLLYTNTKKVLEDNLSNQE